MEQRNLIYPQQPGFKRPGTSQEAAEAISGRAPLLRHRVLLVLGKQQVTADECASLLQESPLSIRPRFSELLSLGKIEEAGERRRNASGRLAAVWRLATTSQRKATAQQEFEL